MPVIEQEHTMETTTARSNPDERLLGGARVLVVDDDESARTIMLTALELAGATVRECATTNEAVRIVRQWHPHVLVSDLAMPTEDGYELIRRLREANESIPALAITAYVRAEDEAHVRAAGFQRHLAKPFDPHDLVHAVRELMG
jgi:CheY-like chemotaxis protein